MRTDYNTIRISNENAVGRIIFNRPHRLNAVTAEFYDELEESITEFENDPSIHVIVLTGEGRAFCVGADLKEHAVAQRTVEEKKKYASAEQTICARIQNSQKLFIAAVNGYALGAGAEMALSADFVIMKDSAEMGFPEVGIGTFLGGGITSLLPSTVGLAKSMELIMLGSMINGSEAHRIGLVYKSVGESEFLGSVDELARTLSEKAPISVGLAKSQLRKHAGIEMKQVLENEVNALLECFETEDWAEGVRAFKEKRKPRFHGK